MFWTIFRLAGVLGLGATVERWFSPGQNNSGENRGGGFNGFVVLLAVAAVIYFIYSLIGKTIRIGK